MKNLLLRTCSGIIYVGIIVAGLIFGQWAFAGMCALFVILAITEFNHLCSNADNGNISKTTMLFDIIGALILSGSAFAYYSGVVQNIGAFFLPAYLIYLILRLIAQLYVRNVSALVSLTASFTGQIYIALPFALMSKLYFDLAEPVLLLAMFIMIWLNDTGAYLVGVSIGRHRLFQRISPKKSWEGFWGGMVFAVGSAFLFHYVFPQQFGNIELWKLIGLGIVVSSFATWGDLVESLLKRTIGVKDSGNLIPGHGGILDRIDSLLLVIPAMTCYLLILECFSL